MEEKAYTSKIIDLQICQAIADSIKETGFYKIKSTDKDNNRFKSTVDVLTSSNFVQSIDDEIYITNEGKNTWTFYLNN